MSERELYCDREIVKTNYEILIEAHLDGKIKDDTELQYYQYYRNLMSANTNNFLTEHYKEMIQKYQYCIQQSTQESEISTYKKMITGYQNKLNIELKNSEIFNLLLFLIESTTPIQNILQREGVRIEKYNTKYLTIEEVELFQNIDSLFIDTTKINAETVDTRTICISKSKNKIPKFLNRIIYLLKKVFT